MTDTTDQNAGLLNIAADIRRKLNDPEGIYSKAPDAKARAEANLSAILLRAGATEPVVTPQMIAEQQHAANFTLRELPAGVTDTIRERTDELAKLDKASIDRLAAELRDQMGAERYDELVKQAGDGATATVRADGYALKILANHARYVQRFRETSPGAKP